MTSRQTQGLLKETRSYLQASFDDPFKMYERKSILLVFNRASGQVFTKISILWSPEAKKRSKRYGLYSKSN